VLLKAKSVDPKTHSPPSLNAKPREYTVPQSILLFTHTCGQGDASQKYSKLQLEKSETEDKIIDPTLISFHNAKQKDN